MGRNWNGPLKKSSDHVFTIPKSYKKGMKVNGWIFADDELIQSIKQDNAPEQVANVATLPGIIEASKAMPDIHWGYGFPIGGVAAMDLEDGVISPGGVGYDINCLPGDTEVLLSFGRRMQLTELRERLDEERVVVAGEQLTDSSVWLFTRSGEQTVYRLETATGEIIESTADHPFATPDGMIELKYLEKGDEVYVQPFRGLEHEDPADVTLLTEEDFEEHDPQILQVLKERDLLPLKTSDDALNYILKVMGYFTGDGSFGGNKQTWFYGEPEGLEDIRSDIKSIGFTPSKVYQRERTHELNGNRFETTEHSFKTTSRAFKYLLLKLGAPEGVKVTSGFETPWFFEDLKAWQKALYYSAYFGAEMNKPSAQSDKNLYCPKISQTRSIDTADAGESFLDDLKDFLENVGVKTNNIESFETDHKDNIRLRLGIKNDSENLIRFFTTVGFRYSRAKQRRAVKAIQYLKTKEREIQRRETIEAEAHVMADGGSVPREIKKQFDINDRFIERSIWSGRTTRPRPGEDFPSFESFVERCTVNDDMTVTSKIDKIERVGEKTVYDIGVEHDAHNFIANNFVVSNCGVRLVKTNLEEDRVRDNIKSLIGTIFDNVPAGVGRKSRLKLKKGELEETLDYGVEWAVDEGYGWEQDLKRIEDNGRMETADSGKVSRKAKDRGAPQLGTLGGGNHFIEIQKVEKIFDEESAKAMDLEEGMITTMIHTGSRGCGHQIATDYIDKMEKAIRKYNIDLPDKQLACAPFDSPEGRDYFDAMSCGANYAWTNRQLILHWVRESFEQIFNEEAEDMDMEMIYDVCHNVAKKEEHEVDGKDQDVIIHRKGATRSFAPGRKEVPQKYRDVGQPVIIPGDMGTASYVMMGTENSMKRTWGSTCHGAGRTMSRTGARKKFRVNEIKQDLSSDGIYVKAASDKVLKEESPGAYKDVNKVVEVTHNAGLSKIVAKLTPIGVMKG